MKKNGGEHLSEPSTVSYLYLVSPFPEPVYWIMVLGIGQILGPDELKFAVLPLDHIGGQSVLIGLLIVRGEFHWAENRHQFGFLQCLFNVFGREGFGPFEDILDHIGSRIMRLPM